MPKRPDHRHGPSAVDTLKPAEPNPLPMRVTVELVGEDSREVEVPEGATYADLVAPLPVSVHQVSVLVDDRHVAEDARIDPDVDTVRVVRLVKGG